MPSIEKMINTPSYDDNLSDAVLAVLKKRKSLGWSQDDLANKAEVELKEVMALESFAYEQISCLTIWKVLFALDLKISIT